LLKTNKELKKFQKPEYDSMHILVFLFNFVQNKKIMDLSQTLQIIPAAVIGLTVHEFAHAYTAYKLGDDTAKNDGRITLNPLKHIDWLGFFLIIIAGFGWAKPVMFNPDNLKHKHRDEILISIAGPLSNLVLALIFFGIARLFYAFPAIGAQDLGIFSIQMLFLWGVINLGLFVFNLIPLPPLDGSHVYLTFLKDTNPVLMTNLYKYGSLALLAIILIENNSSVNILHISDLLQKITGFLIGLFGF
jgi:Zn-dependent protease